MKPLSIRYRLMAVFAVSLLLLFLMTLFSIQLSEQSLKKTVSERSVFLAEVLMDHLLDGLYSVVEDLQFEASYHLFQMMTPLKETVDKGPKEKWAPVERFQMKAGRSIESAELSKHLHSKFIDHYEGKYGQLLFGGVVVTNAQGYVIGRAGQGISGFLGGHLWWKKARQQGGYIGKVRIEPAIGRGIIPISVRITDKKGTFAGVLKADVISTRFFRSRIIGMKPYETSKIHLLTTEGRYLYSTHTYRFMEDIRNSDIFRQITGEKGDFVIEKGWKRRQISYTKAAKNLQVDCCEWIIMVENDQSEVLAPINELKYTIWMLFGISIAGITFMGQRLANSIIRSLKQLQEGASIVGEGDLHFKIKEMREDEIGSLSRAFNLMTKKLFLAMEQLKTKNAEIEEENWIKTGQSVLGELIQDNPDSRDFSQSSIAFLVDYTGALSGVVQFRFIIPGEGLQVHYSKIQPQQERNDVGLSEEVIQEAMNSGDCLFRRKETSADLELTIYEAVIPLQREDQMAGVVYLESSRPFSPIQQRLLRSIRERLTQALDAKQAKSEIVRLLKESQQQSAELKAQRESLGRSNKELERQKKVLVDTGGKLQSQQEELSKSNNELIIKTEALEQKQKEMERSQQQLKTVQGQLEEKARDLERSNKYKSEFMANISHEFRTPLNSLMIFSKILMQNRKNNLDQKQISYSKNIYNSGRDLLALVNSILDLSKIEAGKMNLIIEKLALEDVIDYLENHFRIQAEQKKLDFQLQLDERLPEYIYIDPQRFYQILNNLISNAIKFTETGGIRIEMDLISTPVNAGFGESDQYLSVSVKDTGIGISAEHQKEIFGAFQQAHGSIDRQYGGTGLGLSITLQLLGLMGGWIDLSSIRGEGSTFTANLPLNRNQEGQLNRTVSDFVPSQHQKEDIGLVTFGQNQKGLLPPPLNSPANSADLTIVPNLGAAGLVDKKSSGNLVGATHRYRAKKILVVDDNMQNVYELLGILEKEEISIQVATSLQETIDTLRDAPLPDLILIDVKLTDRTGIEVIIQIRAMDRWNSIPVVALVESSMRDDREQCLASGADGFVGKPLNPRELVAVINNWLFSEESDGTSLEEHS